MYPPILRVHFQERSTVGLYEERIEVYAILFRIFIPPTYEVCGGI